MNIFASKKKEPYNRKAYHAGSWYDQNPDELNENLTKFMNAAEQEITQLKKKGAEVGIPRGVISPHAGYSYSGPTAAFAYVALTEALCSGLVCTILVLHPSHRVYLDGCAISGK